MNGKIRSVGGILAATGIALGAVAISAPAAQADRTDCPATYICAWEHPDFRGYMGKDANNSKNWNNRIENKDSSWYNHGVGEPSAVRIYTKHNWTGDYWCLDAGYWDNYDLDPNDKGSSHKWVYSC